MWNIREQEAFIIRAVYKTQSYRMYVECLG
jgi:hypothetical protein